MICLRDFVCEVLIENFCVVSLFPYLVCFAVFFYEFVFVVNATN